MSMSRWVATRRFKFLDGCRLLVAFVSRFRPVLHTAWLANVFGGLAACLQLSIPLAVVRIINQAIPQRDRTALVHIALLMCVCITAAVVLSFLESLYTAVFRERATLLLEVDLFEHIHRQPFEFFRSSDSGYVMSRISNDNSAAMDAITGITTIGRNFAMLAAGLVLLRYLDWRLGVLTAAILPFYGGLLVFFAKRTRNAYRTISEKTALASKELFDSLSGFYETKAYGAEKYRALRYLQSLTIRARSFIYGRSLMSAGEHVTQSITFLISLVVIAYGGLRVIDGRLSLGEMISFSTVAAYLLIPVNVTVQHVLRAQQTLASIQRIEEWLALPGEDRASSTASSTLANKPASGHIRFDLVTFAYRDRGILLQDINLEIAPGEIILVTGPSGAGKTTLVNLLPRFLEPLSGAIYIDSIPTKSMTLRYLRRQIAYVSQDVFLFSDTVANNIRLGNRRASHEAVREAARLANALDFIEAMPQGFATQVGERGSRLSGGQKQRISIARAILRNAPILILDEATSAVDPETEILVHESLSHLMKSRTTIIVAHHPTAFLETINRVYRLEDCHLELLPRDSAAALARDLALSLVNQSNISNILKDR